MKGMNTPQRPKFPRPKHPRKKIWVLGGILCILCIFFVFRSHEGEEMPQKTRDTLVENAKELHDNKSERKERFSFKEVPLQAQPDVMKKATPQGNSSGTASDDSLPGATKALQKKSQEPSFVMNLAGITATQQQRSIDAVPQKQETTSFAKTLSLKTKRTKRTNNPKKKIAALPRSLDLPDQPPLFAAESTLWNQPFVGFSFEEITAILSEKYKDKQPKEWGEHLSGITSRFESKNASPTVALTLDACGGKKGNGYDAGIIKFLRDKKIPATLFVTSNWVKAHRKEFKELSANPLFEIAAHGATHKPLSVNGKSVYNIQGTASIEEVVIEVESNARELHRLITKRPKWFRSGTAYYDEIAVSIVKDLGLGIAGFSIAGDEGATLSAKEVEKKILSAQNGDIIVCHFNHPESGTREGLRSALLELLKRGYTFTTLSQALGKQ